MTLAFSPLFHKKKVVKVKSHLFYVVLGLLGNVKSQNKGKQMALDGDDAIFVRETAVNPETAGGPATSTEGGTSRARAVKTAQLMTFIAATANQQADFAADWISTTDNKNQRGQMPAVERLCRTIANDEAGLRAAGCPAAPNAKVRRFVSFGWFGFV